MTKKKEAGATPRQYEAASPLISDVRTNFSVAQVLPDTLRGVLQNSDLAVLVHPS